MRPSLVNIAIIIIALVLLFGVSRIPAIARTLGRSIGEFKKGLKDGEIEKEDRENDKEKQEE